MLSLVKTQTCPGAHIISCSHLLNTSPHNPTQANWAFALQFPRFVIMITPFSLPRAIRPVWAKQPHSVVSTSMRIPVKSRANVFFCMLTGQVLTSASNSLQERAQGNVSNISQFFKLKACYSYWQRLFVFKKSTTYQRETRQNKGLLIFLKITAFDKKNKLRNNAQPYVTLTCSLASAHFYLGNFSSFRTFSHVPWSLL